MAEKKTVSVTIIDAVKVDGVHYAVGDVLKDIDVELAKELAGAGRARLASDEDMAPKKPAKA